jgi:2-C-methyl-D-erythritol 4-phosphate cytidylyltransferase
MPKQYHLVGGVPVVVRALHPFITHPDVAHVVLVLPPRDAANPPAFLYDSSLRSEEALSVLSVVAGGTHRADSVRAGLAALRPECAVVLVHDGARPFVERTLVDLVVEYARRGESACPAIPLSDTLKEVAAHDPTRIVRTRPRSRLWRAQTPQGFPRKVLEEAHTRAARLGHRATDDCALVESMGQPVRLVADSSRNIKITTPEDLTLAELLAGGPR